METNCFQFLPHEEKIIITLPNKNPLTINKESIAISYFSAGHGGQNLNRHMNGVRLIYRIPIEYQLPFKKTKEIISKCITQRHRERNFHEALEHLAEKLKLYFYMPPHRKKTRVPKSSQLERISEKKMRGEVKRNRKKIEI